MFGRKKIEARHYLDWAAAAPVSERAARAFAAASSVFANPSSPHTEGQAARRTLEDARTKVARELSVKADDVIFTSGATEANNLAIQSVATKARKSGTAQPHLLYLQSAHASVVETMKAMEGYGFITEALPVANGEVDVEKLKKMVRAETVLVSMDFVCGETGTVWNTRSVKQALPAHVLLHVDAAQAPYEELCERTRVGADLLVLDAQKIGGVRGCGVLIAARTLGLAPMLHGGGQERGMRSGTPSPALAAAFAEALVEVGEKRESFAARAQQARAEFLSAISAIPNHAVNQGRKGVAHIVNLSFPGRDTDYLAALLDEAGFAVSTKSACESDSQTGSRAVAALTQDAERAKATLRISWGPTTGTKELAGLARALTNAVTFLDTHSL